MEVAVTKKHLILIGGRNEDIPNMSDDDEHIAIIETCDRLYSAWAARDIDLLMDLWSDSGGVGGVFPGGYPICHKASMRDSWIKFFEEFPIESVVPAGSLALISGKVAVVSQVECAAMVVNGGRCNPRFSATMVFFREDEGWRLIRRHMSLADMECEEDKPPY